MSRSLAVVVARCQCSGRLIERWEIGMSASVMVAASPVIVMRSQVSAVVSSLRWAKTMTRTAARRSRGWSVAPGTATRRVRGVGRRVRRITGGRGPGGESSGGGGAGVGCLGKLSRLRIEVALHSLNPTGFDGNAPILAPFPCTCMTVPSAVRRTSEMLARNSSSERRPASREIRISARTLSIQSDRPGGPGSVSSTVNSAATESTGRGLG